MEIFSAGLEDHGGDGVRLHFTVLLAVGGDKGAHPFHRSWMQAQYDAYIANEVFPFIDSICQTSDIPIASLGAYHAANTLFKHPDPREVLLRPVRIYDMSESMDGMYDDKFYFNTRSTHGEPERSLVFRSISELRHSSPPGTRPWEVSGPTYRMSEVLHRRAIAHNLDDWGPRKAATTGPIGITGSGNTWASIIKRRSPAILTRSTG